METESTIKIISFHPSTVPASLPSIIIWFVTRDLSKLNIVPINTIFIQIVAHRKNFLKFSHQLLYFLHLILADMELRVALFYFHYFIFLYVCECVCVCRSELIKKNSLPWNQQFSQGRESSSIPYILYTLYILYILYTLYIYTILDGNKCYSRKKQNSKRSVLRQL